MFLSMKLIRVNRALFSAKQSHIVMLTTVDASDRASERILYVSRSDDLDDTSSRSED